MNHKIQQLVSSISNMIKGDQKLAVPVLSVKLAKCQKEFPQDKTIGSVSRIINDMSYNKTFFIRQADFADLYNKSFTVGTKFGQLFAEELGQDQVEPQITTYQRSNTDETINVDTYQAGDQVLANALNSAFDNSPLKMYSQPMANKALKSVGSSLNAWNLTPSSLTIGAGSDKFIIVKADYETPKGITSLYVPVEVNKNTVIEPDLFMGNLGPEDLNHSTIKAYVTQQAGAKSKIGASDILAAITNATEQKREITATELAVTRLNAVRQGSTGEVDFSAGQVFGLKVNAEAKQDVQLPKSDEFASFEEQFTSVKGQAAFTFGAELVAAARTHLTRELQSFGFHTPQIVITKSDKNTIFYGVSLDTGKTAFTVPVKIANKKLVKPTVLLCNGSITTFSQEGINQLVSENKSDSKIASVASVMSTLKPSEILNNLRTALADGNHAKAEDALNVLANGNDEKAYATGFQIYMSSLAGIKTASTKCSKMIKTAQSEYQICSHTGLPIHKVYQDKDGFCHPMYRQGMSETYEGASFINAKIFG